MIKNVSFTEADVTNVVIRDDLNVITVNMTTAHGIVEGHNVYLTIMTKMPRSERLLLAPQILLSQETTLTNSSSARDARLT